MKQLATEHSLPYTSLVVSNYDDFGKHPADIPLPQRIANAQTVIDRFFVADGKFENLAREAIVRSVNAGESFLDNLRDAESLAEGGFGPELPAPSTMVESAFRDYALTELGAVALARLIEWDNQFIDKGWRMPDGTITEQGFMAYGEGQWRPFRVASSIDEADTVTPSGVLMLPDVLEEERYSTGDISHPLALIHHELKAHVLPLKEAEGLVPGKEMELICVRLESEMLSELGLNERQLNWGKDDGTLDHTLHEASEQYYHGLVATSTNGSLVEIDPDTGKVIGAARLKG